VDEARPGTALLLALLGALLGTLITLLLDTTPTVRAIGAILGALIPTLVGHVGPWHYPRAAVGIGVTVCALFITYGGFTAFDYAAGKEETFPIPEAMPAPNPPPSPPAPPIVTTENGLSLVVSPNKVQCRSDGCDEVTVTSTGDEVVQIGGIEFVGAAADDFGYGGSCEQGPLLQKGETCGVSVSFTPSGASGTRIATLRIHHNVGPDPSDVPVEGEFEGGGPPPPPPPSVGDLVASRGGIRCQHLRGGAIVNGELKDAIQIFFRLRFLEASDGPNSVFVIARSDRGPRGQSSGIRDGERDVALALEPDDYGRQHRVTVTLDPDRKVSESNEGNNRLTVIVELPAQPGSPQRLPCRAF
jgi:hypothetical protein